MLSIERYTMNPEDLNPEAVDAEATETVATEEVAVVEGESTGEKRGRGRPRPEQTKARDEKVLELLRETPSTRNAIAEATGETTNSVYLSLYRLRVAGAIKRVSENGRLVWATACYEPAVNTDELVQVASDETAVEAVETEPEAVAV